MKHWHAATRPLGNPEVVVNLRAYFNEDGTILRLAGKTWKALDVGYAEQLEEGYIPGVIHLSLPELRHRSEEVLNKEGKYKTICRSGKRSVVAPRCSCNVATSQSP